MTTPREDLIMPRLPPAPDQAQKPGRFGGIGGLFGGMGGYNPFMGGGFNPYQQQRPMMGGFNPYQQQRPMMGGFNPYQQQRMPFMGGGFNPYQQQRMPFMGGGFNPYQQQRMPFMGGGFNPYQQRMPFMGGGFNPYMGGGFNPYQQQRGPQSINDLFSGLDEDARAKFFERFGLATQPPSDQPFVDDMVQLPGEKVTWTNSDTGKTWAAEPGWQPPAGWGPSWTSDTEQAETPPPSQPWHPPTPSDFFVERGEELDTGVAPPPDSGGGTDGYKDPFGGKGLFGDRWDVGDTGVSVDTTGVYDAPSTTYDRYDPATDTYYGYTRNFAWGDGSKQPISMKGSEASQDFKAAWETYGGAQQPQMPPPPSLPSQIQDRLAELGGRMLDPVPPGPGDPGLGDPDGLTMGTLGGPGYGEYPLGTAGPRVDPGDPNYIPPPSTNGGGFSPQFPPGMFPVMGAQQPSFSSVAGQTVNERGQPIRPDGGGGSMYTPPPSADSRWVPDDDFWTNSGGSWQPGASQDPAMQAQVQAQFDRSQQLPPPATAPVMPPRPMRRDYGDEEGADFRDDFREWRGDNLPPPPIPNFPSQSTPPQFDLGSYKDDIMNMVRDNFAIPQFDPSQLQGRLAELEGREIPQFDPSQIRGRLAELEGREIPQQFDASGLKSRLGQLEARKIPQFDPSQLREQISGLQQQVGSIYQFDPSQLQQQIGNIPQFDPSQLQSRLAELEGREIPQQFDPGRIRGRLAELEGREIPQQFDPSQLREQIGGLQQQIGNIPQFDPSQLQEQIGGLQGQLGGLKERQGGLFDSLENIPSREEFERMRSESIPLVPPNMPRSPGVNNQNNVLAPIPASGIPLPAPMDEETRRRVESERRFGYGGEIPQGMTPPAPGGMDPSTRLLDDVRKQALFQSGDGTIDYNPETGNYILNAFGVTKELTAEELAKQSGLDLGSYAQAPMPRVPTPGPRLPAPRVPAPRVSAPRLEAPRVPAPMPRLVEKVLPWPNIPKGTGGIKPSRPIKGTRTRNTVKVPPPFDPNVGQPPPMRPRVMPPLPIMQPPTPPRGIRAIPRPGARRRLGGGRGGP